MEKLKIQVFSPVFPDVDRYRQLNLVSWRHTTAARFAMTSSRSRLRLARLFSPRTFQTSTCVMYSSSVTPRTEVLNRTWRALLAPRRWCRPSREQLVQGSPTQEEEVDQDADPEALVRCARLDGSLRCARPADPSIS
jgi:hypothetical protein